MAFEASFNLYTAGLKTTHQLSTQIVWQVCETEFANPFDLDAKTRLTFHVH
jgi:hypothetical protein